MTEILVVIGIIVLLLAIGIPAFSFIRGGRSLDAAENQVAAMLGRARADAIGLQKPHGVMFVRDKDEDRVYVAEVFATDYPATGTPARDVYLDLVADVEMIALPPGTCVQVLNTDPPGGPTDDRYIGFNRESSAGLWGGRYNYGGVILFNGKGQLISRTYGYRTGENPNPTRFYNVLQGPGTGGYSDIGTGAAPVYSAFGFVLFDRAQYSALFRNVTNLDAHHEDLQLSPKSGTPAAEAAEERWIDENAIQVMVNRYNGSLTRGQ